MVDPHPFLKWAGGKTRLLPELLKRAPAKFNVYREPFLGGGALFFALRAQAMKERRAVLAVLSDSNAELITAYRAIRDDLHSVIFRLRAFEGSYGREQFNRVRSSRYGLPADVAARMIYLNKTCFNGLYRVNQKGEFNSPFGKYENPTICDRENLSSCSVALYGAEICCCDFRESLGAARMGDFVYLDPPYVPTSKTSSFTAYTPGGFSIDDQIELALAARDAKGRGVHVLISAAGNSDSRELYQGFAITEVQARRNINCDGGKRGNVTELLIT
jgi:DNA adenine methylase